MAMDYRVNLLKAFGAGLESIDYGHKHSRKYCDERWVRNAEEGRLDEPKILRINKGTVLFEDEDFVRKYNHGKLIFTFYADTKYGEKVMKEEMAITKREVDLLEKEITEAAERGEAVCQWCE